MNRSYLRILAVLAVLGASQPIQAQSTSGWSQLRGDSGMGRAPADAKPATRIDLDQQRVWETSIPGTGWSSPVYDQGLIWMTSSTTKQATQAEIDKKLQGDPLARIKTLASQVDLMAVAVDRKSGKLVHQVSLHQIDQPEPINPMNSYASPTPAIADGRVVCHFGAYGTWCLDAKTGQKLWQTRYKIDHSVGPGSSPIIVNNKVILVCDGMDQQFIVAVDLESGKEIWKTDRPPIRASNGEQRKAYCTPLLIEVEQQRQLVIPGAQWIAAYDPEDGKEIWRVDHGGGFSVTPMPIYDSGLVVFSTGYTKPELVAVDPTGKGDVTESHVRWRHRGAPTMPSLIVDGGRIYSLNDKGIMTCLDVTSGEVINQRRVGGSYASSPLLAGGNLYVGNRDGKLTILSCSSEMETISTSEFEGSIMASPILIGNDLLIRTENKLVRIRPGT